MTNREWLNQMNDSDFANWLCMQMFFNCYTNNGDPYLNTTRFNIVLTFLKMEHIEKDNE